jgi:succinate dehydrogenase hydrophobic anchor subunit
MNLSENYKLFYGALCGFCTAVLLALINSDIEISIKSPGFWSAIIFGFLVPLFAGFVIAHMVILEKNIPKDVAESALSARWVKIITGFALTLLYVGLALLAFQLSKWVGLAFLLSTLVVYFSLKCFVLGLSL